MVVTLEERLNILEKLGHALGRFDGGFEALCQKAFQKNNWFTPDNTKFAAQVWAETLTREKLLRWASHYPKLGLTPGPSSRKNRDRPKERGEGRVAVINAGNIPFAGMHDLLSIFITGNKYIGKNSSDDPYLMPYIVDLLVSIDARLKDDFQFADRLVGTDINNKPFDAIIATGSNNSAHYFKYYFKNYPHIIRRNRNAVAVLSGRETKEELHLLGEDIFRYFGLGCRNVSKLYVPEGYGFKNFFEAIYSFSAFMQHNKYMNNFDYNNTILLMNKTPFLQNGFLIVREESRYRRRFRCCIMSGIAMANSFLKILMIRRGRFNVSLLTRS